MKNKIIKVGDLDFTVYTEKNTTVEIEKPLYDLIAVDEFGYNVCTETFTVGSSFRLKELLNQIKDDGIEEYTGITNSDLELLNACIKLLKTKKVDRIIFELCL